LRIPVEISTSTGFPVPLAGPEKKTPWWWFVIAAVSLMMACGYMVRAIKR